MGLKDIGASLPPGFRFHPSDEELVCHYLYKKIANEESLKGTLVEIDLHTCEPWQLPDVAKLNASEWYFFSFRDRKYATGFRTNRATTTGYWKATGKDRTVHDPVTKDIVGMRKTLVFYRNRAPNGIKTGWIMHEFRLETPHMPPKEDWVLCRVFHKSKGEDNNKHNPDMMFETAASGAPSLSSLSSSPLTDRTTLPNYNFHHQITSASSTPSHHQHHNQNSLLNLLQARNTSINIADFNSDQGDDDYAFIWEMNLEEAANSLGNHGLPSNFEEMRFDNIDNSLVFL